MYVIKDRLSEFIAETRQNCARERANLRNTFRMLLTQRLKNTISDDQKKMFLLKLNSHLKIMVFSKFLSKYHEYTMILTSNTSKSHY